MFRLTLFLSAFVVLFYACGEKLEKEVSKVQEISGEAQGTTYTIKYIDSAQRDIKPVVDSLLEVIDLSVSTYNSKSILSQFNAADSCFIINNHVLDLFLMSDEVYQNSKGAFDPTIKPVSELYGFGGAISVFDTLYLAVKDSALRDSLTQAYVDSTLREVLEYVGWENVILDGDILYNSLDDLGKKEFRDNFLCKEDRELKMSFDAIAQGYSADVIGDFLIYQMGINDFIIEIGGEVLAQGCKPDQKSWTVQIENPDLQNPNAAPGIATVPMDKFRALAVSGNYRNHRQVGGKQIGHIIDPRTGKAAESRVISVAVFADDCAMADAYATAFMIMGVEEAVPFVEGNPSLGVEAYFVYYNREGTLQSYVSTGLEDLIKP